MNRYLRHPLTASVAVFAAVAVVLGLAQLTLPAESGVRAEPQPGRAPLGRATAVCPEPSFGRIAVATSPGGDSTGRAVVRTLGDEESGREVGELRRRGAVWTEEVGDDGPAHVVSAEGAMAAGLEAEQTSNTGSGPGQGLSSTRCVRPDTDFWFVSDGVTLGRSTRLFLTNIDETPVSVNVEVYGPDGPQPSAAGRGITVEPHSRNIVDLGALAPDAPVVALRVHAMSGRVSASLHTRSGQGQKALGIDWVPQTLGPRKELVVPGLPPGQGSRRLLLAAPGNRAAEVRIQLVTGKGTYQPKGEDVIRVASGSVKTVRLGESLSNRAAAVRITSNVPVTAAAAASVSGEVGYTAAVPALRGSGAVIADNGPDDGVDSKLLLSAPVKAGAVRVTLLGPRGPVGQPRTVKIRAGRTAKVGLSPDAVQGNFAVVVTPTDAAGPVYGARMLSQDLDGQTSLTMLPLRTSKTWVEVPDADASLSAVMSG